MCERTAWKLASQMGWFSSYGKKKARKAPAGPPVHDDLVAYQDEHGVTRHSFRTEKVNALWLTDITEHHTGEGKLYTCMVKDVAFRRIVGYSIGPKMTATLAVDALANAVVCRKREGQNLEGCIVHSDCGSQFRSRKYLRALEAYGLTGSTGRVGACGDNAAMESFFALLQNNVLNRQTWPNRQSLRLAIVAWIEKPTAVVVDKKD